MARTIRTIQSVKTLKLELNSNINKELVKTFSSLKDLKFAYISKNIGTIVLTRVPANIEDEVTKYIFNGVMAYELKQSNKELAKKIFI